MGVSDKFPTEVMIGREAYENPWSLTSFHRTLLTEVLPATSRSGVVEDMAAYAEIQRRRGVPLRSITRHMLGLFNGLPGARAWRRRLSALDPADGPEVLLEAATLVERHRELAA